MRVAKDAIRARRARGETIGELMRDYPPGAVVEALGIRYLAETLGISAAAPEVRDWCPYCGTPVGDHPGDRLVCPRCGRDGCSVCMPAGRGCPCPECETVGEDD